MKGKSVFLLVMVSTSVFAADCVYGSVVTLPINVGLSSIRASVAWTKIGDGLQQQFGNTLINLEGNVKIPVKFAFTPSPVPADMAKICGETMKEAAERAAKTKTVANGGGGDGGGAGGSGGGGGGSVGPDPNPGDCYGNCGGIVTVGEPKKAAS